MSNSEGYSAYGAGGTGAHPTLAGNMLDPNIRSDGNMSGGPGVGGTSERHVREEGAEHIRQNPETTSSSVQAGGYDGSSSGYGSSSGGLRNEFSSGSGSGYNSTSGGLTSGLSGTGGSGYDSTDRSNSGTSGGIVDTALSYVGLGSKTSGQQSGIAGESRDTSSYSQGTGSTGLTGASGLGSSLGSSHTHGEHSHSGLSGSGLGSESLGDRSYDGQAGSGLGSSHTHGGLTGSGLGSSHTHGEHSHGGLSGSGLGSQSVGNQSYGGQSGSGLGSETYGDRSYGSQSGSGLGSDGASGLNTSNLGSSREDAVNQRPSDSDVTTGTNPIDSTGPHATGSEGAGLSKQSKEAQLADKHASTRENVDAIPTAGGEKLGQKHWGESKIVPEVPKLADDDVSDTVRDNTHRNAGHAGHAGHADATGSEKESIVDKMKDALHLGK